MERESFLDRFQFTSSDPNAMNFRVVKNYGEFMIHRHGNSDFLASSVRIFLDGRHFVHPIWISHVKQQIIEAYPAKKPDLKGSSQCLFSWIFKKPLELEDFDRRYSGLPPNMLLKVNSSRRILLPQGVRSFLAMSGYEERLLDNWTCSFQHFPSKNSHVKDNCNFYAEEIFKKLQDLMEAESSSNEDSWKKLVTASCDLQRLLSTRLGVACKENERAVKSHQGPSTEYMGSRESESSQLEATTVTVASEDEAQVAHSSADESDELELVGSKRTFAEAAKKKNKNLLKQLKGLFSHQSTLKNCFGNIIVNAGSCTIIGGRLPSLSISYEAAKRLPCWDHDISLNSLGDLKNDELLGMIQSGPIRSGGAWTLHSWFNQAIAIPASGFNEKSDARRWLEKQLLRSAMTYFERTSSDAISKPDWEEGQGTLQQLLKESLSLGTPLLELLNTSFSNQPRLLQWLREQPSLLPPVNWITAVHRHSRTGDLVGAVRHPITQPIPHFQLMVDATILGSAIRYPPQFCDLAGADFDGDKEKLQIQKSVRKREVCEQKLSVPKLIYNAMGKKVVKLTGVAPLALNLLQKNGAYAPDLYAVMRETPEERVLWPGVLETVYSPTILFEVCRSVGTAIPKLLSFWAKPRFE